MASKYQGVHKESTGYKMLAALGWKEGEGLGSKKQGITEHLRVKKKHERVGVGAAEAAAKARDWTLGMVAYDRVLSGLSEVTSQHAAGRDDDSDSSDGEDAEQPAEAAAAAAAPSSKAARAAKKVAKTEAKAAPSKKLSKKRKSAAAAAPPPAPVSADTSSSDSDSSESEAEAVAEPEVKRVRRATHVGRFKKREAGKRVGGYSSTDLAAILGGNNPWEQRAEEVETDEELQRAATPDTPSTSEPHKPTSSDSPRPNEGQAARDADASSAQRQADEQTWWNRYFVRAGRLGAIRRVKPSEAKIKVDGFEEADQEALWTTAHDGKSKSKQGLGRSGQPKKVAGVHWAGTKTKLDSDDDDEDGGSADGGDDSESEEEELAGVVMVAPKRAPPAAAAAAAAAAVAASSGAAARPEGVSKHSGLGAKRAVAVAAAAPSPAQAAALGSVKWKKIAKRVLEAQHKGTLKLSKLSKLAVAGAKLPAGTDEGAAAAAFEARLRGSSMFSIKGKSVSLTADP